MLLRAEVASYMLRAFYAENGDWEWDFIPPCCSQGVLHRRLSHSPELLCIFWIFSWPDKKETSCLPSAVTPTALILHTPFTQSRPQLCQPLSQVPTELYFSSSNTTAYCSVPAFLAQKKLPSRKTGLLINIFSLQLSNITIIQKKKKFPPSFQPEQSTNSLHSRSLPH